MARGGESLEAGQVLFAGGCCSSIFPCSHQRADPNTICDICAAANSISNNEALITVLRLALPYVEQIAARAPTQPANILRQRQAVKDAAAIRAALSKAKGGAR